jgi:hypothetical protein
MGTLITYPNLKLSKLIFVTAGISGVLLFYKGMLWLESSMATHVLIQLPALILCGWYIGSYYRGPIDKVVGRYNHWGLAGLLLATFTLIFWMLPRSLDSAINNSFVDLSKHISLVVFAGIPLAISWPKLNTIAKCVVKIELLTMLYRLGWLYLVSPIRLCNNYGLDEQIMLGRWMLVVGVLLSLYWIIPLFFRDYRLHLQHQKP